MNIYVHPDLRDRMREFDRRRGLNKVNWSEVAQAAFEKELESLHRDILYLASEPQGKTKEK